MTPVPEETWSPILEGEVATRADAAVTAVAEAIREASVLPDRNVGAGFAGGKAGFALFYEYLDRARPGAGYGDLAQQRLEQAIDQLATAAQDPSLFSGFTGISWAVEHLQGGPAEDGEDDEDPNADIDEALLALLSKRPWPHDYDLVSGLVGYGVYALERLPRPSAVTCLELVVEHLAELAQSRPEGLAWHTPLSLVPEQNLPWYPEGLDNLGLAHGSPGVVALLARICVSGVAAERARSLLGPAVSWLLAQKLTGSEISVFPYAVGSGFKIRPARTAWCYGDPGIALALLAAGRLAEEPAWEREALDVARAAARRPPENCNVNDAGLCHGAAGLGHVLNRLYQATGDPELLESARAWFARSLDYWDPSRGIGGFLTYTPIDESFDVMGWIEDAGLLIGSTGMALCLLAATSGVDPAWDRLMLMSPLPGKRVL
jgi:lantibiotic modifying enzyme